MTLRRRVFEGRSTDELDNVIQVALCESVGRIQPPAYVWREIRQKVQCRKQRRKRVVAERYARDDGFYQPIAIFSVWGGRVPLSLACIIEQQVPMLLGVGWAT